MHSVVASSHHNDTHSANAVPRTSWLPICQLFLSQTMLHIASISSKYSASCPAAGVGWSPWDWWTSCCWSTATPGRAYRCPAHNCTRTGEEKKKFIIKYFWPSQWSSINTHKHGYMVQYCTDHGSLLWDHWQIRNRHLIGQQTALV